jgi:hypothetical protein
MSRQAPPMLAAALHTLRGLSGSRPMDVSAALHQAVIALIEAGSYVHAVHPGAAAAVRDIATEASRVGLEFSGTLGQPKPANDTAARERDLLEGAR